MMAFTGNESSAKRYGRNEGYKNQSYWHPITKEEAPAIACILDASGTSDPSLRFRYLRTPTKWQAGEITLLWGAASRSSH